MDRTILYPGAIPLAEDGLSIQRNAMLAIGYLAQATLGTGAVADGLACGPTSPASMTLEVGPGSLTALSVVDGSAFSTLPASLNPVVKMGITGGYTSLTFSAPPVAGQSVDYLIQAAFEELDGVPLVLPYYNAANSAQPYSGPGGGGASQATVRSQQVVLQLKAGIPAVSGTQVAPVADAGWSPLYVVSIPAGTTQLTGANVSVAPGAPFLGLKLPGLDAAVAALQAAVAALQVSGNGETARAEAVEANLNAAIGAEVVRAEAAEANLGNALNTAEANLNAAIAAEGVTRNQEVGDATNTLNNALAAEAQARGQGDAAVSASIAPAIAAAIADINSEFPAGLGANGWAKLSSGLIIQWGVGVSAGGGETNVYYPVVFPNGAFSVVACEGQAEGWVGPGGITPSIHAPSNVAGNGFTMLTAEILPGGGTQLQGGLAFYWLATGY